MVAGFTRNIRAASSTVRYRVVEVPRYMAQPFSVRVACHEQSAPQASHPPAPESTSVCCWCDRSGSNADNQH